MKKLQTPDKPKAQKKTKTALSQSEKFKEAAKELGRDDDEEAFRSKLKKLTEAPPPDSEKERMTKKR